MSDGELAFGLIAAAAMHMRMRRRLGQRDVAAAADDSPPPQTKVFVGVDYGHVDEPELSDAAKALIKAAQAKRERRARVRAEHARTGVKDSGNNAGSR